MAAIQAGKHVLLQKPVAPTLADAEAIAEAAAKSTRTVGLYMSYFDQPLIHDLRDMVTQGWLGDIVHCYARLMHKGGMMWSDEALAGKPNWRGSVAQTGGGCFIQLAVHYVHIFEWATGARVVRASGFARNLHCPGLEGEDLAVGVFELDTGAMLTIDTAWCTNGEELSVHGTQGRFTYRDNKLALCSNVGAYSRTRGGVFGRQVAAVRRSVGRRAADGSSAAGVRRHHQPVEPALAVSGSGARRTARAGVDRERRTRYADRGGAVRIDAYGPRGGGGMKLGIVSR